MDKYVLILSINLIFCLLPVMAGYYAWRAFDRARIILFIYLHLVIIAETIGLINTAAVRNNLWFYHIFAPISYYFIIIIFSYYLRNKTIKKIARLSIVIYIAVSITMSALSPDKGYFNFLAVAIANFCYLVLSILILAILFSDDENRPMELPHFWLTAGLFIYSTGNILYYAIFDFIAKEHVGLIWMIHLAINMLSNVFYTIGLMADSRLFKKVLSKINPAH